MKLLLDENLSRKLVPLLEESFPGTSHVSILGLERSSDREIWEYAKGWNFVIVTRDSDFYELSTLHGSPPKLVWIKGRNLSKAEILDVLLRSKFTIVRHLEEENTVCVALY